MDAAHRMRNHMILAEPMVRNRNHFRGYLGSAIGRLATGDPVTLELPEGQNDRDGTTGSSAT